MTGSAKTLHSHTSDFTTLICHNLKSTNDHFKIFTCYSNKLNTLYKPKLQCVKFKKLDLCEWRVFAEPVTNRIQNNLA